MSTNRMSYHTIVKDLFKKGLLPEHLLKQIPRQTRNRWRKENSDKYFGSELNDEILQYGDALKTVASFPKVLHTVTKCLDVYSDILGSTKAVKKIIKNSKDKVVNAILDAKKTISVDQAVKIFNISKSTFKTWLVQVKSECEGSFLKLCNRYNPNQLTYGEVLKIKELVTYPDYLKWPIRSIQAFAFREGIVRACLSTWYRYVGILDLRPKKVPVSKKDILHEEIITTHPNEMWHADITLYRTMDGIVHYIYLVVDNFSRKILSWAIHDKSSAEVRKQTLVVAYENALSLGVDLNVKLVVDGGSENNNRVIDNFIENSKFNVKKCIALKEGMHSNSAVEAVNKTIKYHYLFPEPSMNRKEIEIQFPKVIYDYNEVRPHGRLFYQTPDEAYAGIIPDRELIQALSEQASKKRLEFNKNTSCRRCLAFI